VTRLRPNVCIVLTDPARARVLVFRRTDRPPGEEAWQFPQGGMAPGETPRQAALRELEEEVGTAAADLVAQAPEPIAYEYPPEVLRALPADDSEKAGIRGQVQHWFLGILREGTAAIRFDRRPAEFDAFRWVTPTEAVTLVVDFKREAYRRGLRALGLLPAPEAGDVG